MLGLPVELAGNDFDGDDAGQQGIEGLVDRPHPALAKFFQDFVAPYRFHDRLIR